MESKYIYRKHLRGPGKFFLTVALMIIIPYFIIASALAVTDNHQDKTEMWLFILIIGGFMAAFISIEYLLIYFIIYWIKTIHNKGNIRLTVTLQSIGDMVKGLKSKPDEKNISNVYNDKAIYNFIKTAEYSDQSWERVYDNLKVFVIAISLSVGATVIASIFITEIIVKIFVSAGSLVGPLLAFIISEIIFARELAKGASKENFYVPDRDKQFELKIYKWTFGIYLILFLIVLIMIIVQGM